MGQGQCFNAFQCAYTLLELRTCVRFSSLFCIISEPRTALTCAGWDVSYQYATELYEKSNVPCSVKNHASYIIGICSNSNNSEPVNCHGNFPEQSGLWDL